MEIFLVVLAIEAGIPVEAADSDNPSRFSEQPLPLRSNEFPERPPPLLELGDRFLGTGEVNRGFTLPTGAVWNPSFQLFGNFRAAAQTFDDGATRTSEWANRLDLYGNLQLAATERILVGFRPLDRNGGFTGYNFEPASRRGFEEHFSLDSLRPTTLFFEGEFGEIFPRLDKADQRNLDYGFSVGRQPLLLQDGMLVNDDSIDLVSITRNALLPKGGSQLKVSALFGWNEIERNNNVQDNHARLFGIDARADFFRNTVEADALYVTADGGGDGFYAGLGSIQRFGRVNTTFRVNTSLALERSSSRVSNGTLLFTEISLEPTASHNLLYLDAFWGIDRFSSADRGPFAGGPLGRTGILFAAVGLGRYGSPLSNQAAQAAGGALGYQMFFGEFRRRQLIVELGGRAPTTAVASSDKASQASGGVGARLQQAFGRRFVVVLDAFGVVRENSRESFGGRLELLVKF